MLKMGSTPHSLSEKKMELASGENIHLGFGVGLFWLWVFCLDF